jgi:hypothetical protein
MKDWEIIADQLSRAGWTWGYVSAFSDGRKTYVVDAHRDDGNRFIVRSDKLSIAFQELQNTLRELPRKLDLAGHGQVI